jgi:methionine-rich copper-binding protein CopC
MSTKRVALTGMVVALCATAAPARAHGDIQATDPEARATVPRAPRSVAVTFTEAPTAQAVLRVTDGCNRDVGQGVDVAGATATVRVATGQPGRWRVSYRVISAVDGHLTRGGYAFTVAGEEDCIPDEEATPEPGDAPPTRAAPPGDDDDPDGSGAPVVPIALGAAGLIVLALIVRRSGSG